MSDERFRALVAHVGEFHVTDRALKAAQQEAEAALATDEVSASTRSRYLKAVANYFTPFEEEARAHLRDVDKRLEHANQVVFNLTAERGVAVKRIEATQAVLAEIEKLR